MSGASNSVEPVFNGASPLNVRFWPHAPLDSVASTRIRVLQVINGLRVLGVDAALTNPNEDRAGSAVQALVLGKRYDVASMQYALDLRAAYGTRIVLDLCDNHFHADKDESRWQARTKQLRAACLQVDLVVASTAALAEAVHAACGSHARVEVVPDSLDNGMKATSGLRHFSHVHAMRLRLFDFAYRTAPGRRLLWFGNHGFSYAGGGMEDLSRIAPALALHHRRAPLRLVVVSNRWETYRRLARGWSWPSLYLPWSSANFQSALRESDVAVIPVQRNAFTLCKSNNRPASAFMHGLGVAADGLPSYEDLRAFAVLDDWISGLAVLMNNAALRARNVEAAQAYLTQTYSVSQVAARWAQVLKLLMGAQR